MKNPTELKEIRSKLNLSEISDLNWLHTELGNFLASDDVSTGGVTTLENMSNSLNNLRRAYTQRVISLLKTGHLLN